MTGEHTESITLEAAELGTYEDGARRVSLRTDRGTIDARLHEAGEGGAAVVWVGGAGGGLSGPARGLYPRLAGQLAPPGTSSLRLHYRRPNDLVECVLDTLLGVGYLETLGRSRFALVGHSFGGAVVIAAGASAGAVAGVAALSSQTYGADAVGDLSPKALLLLHGGADEILPDSCSRSLYARAGEPRELHLYPGCRHGLDECRGEVDRDLLSWLRRVLA